MRIAQIIGTVTLSRCHPSLVGGTFRLAAAYSLEELQRDSPPQADPLVLYDQWGAGQGSRVALSESREAAAPFYPDIKPVDAYNAAILDHITIEKEPS